MFLDLDPTLDKACALIRQAAVGGAQLVACPEAFVAGYPVWGWVVPSGKTHPLRHLYTRLHQSAVSTPGPGMDRLRGAAHVIEPLSLSGCGAEVTGHEPHSGSCQPQLLPDSRLRRVARR